MMTIKKIAIVGAGFMGGSLALALRKAYPGVYLCGYARSRSSFNKLYRLRILDKVERDLKKVIIASDIVVLSLPVYAIIDCFKKISPFLKDDAIVFDMGSTKESIEKAAQKILPKQVSFVGCHPLCGSEKSGAQFAEANLYRGALCIITSRPANNAVVTIGGLWEKVGSKVIFMSAAQHDKILSVVSHLNHIISFAVTHNIPYDYLKFAPPSLKDLTRIASSPASVWADIFIANKKNILRDIKKFKGVLEKFESLIAIEKRKALIDLIENINKKQQEI